MKKGSVVLFNRKLLHQGGANYSDKPRTALLLQAIMPFGVKMESMECQETYQRLMMEAEKRRNEIRLSIEEDISTKEIIEKYFGLSEALKEKLHYRLHGPRFPRDMDAAAVEEKNN